MQTIYLFTIIPGVLMGSTYLILTSALPETMKAAATGVPILFLLGTFVYAIRRATADSKKAN